MPWERRVGRFLETIEICRALWPRDNVSFSGKHFTLDDVTVEPKPHRPGGPPIWIGGSGPTALPRGRALRRVVPDRARASSSSPSTSRRSRRRRARPGAPADAVTGAAYVTLALDPDAAAAEQRLTPFLETYYAAPARAIMARQATYAGPIEGCVEWLQRWIDAGARHLALRFAGGDQLAQVDEAAARLLPRLKAVDGTSPSPCPLPGGERGDYLGLSFRSSRGPA